MNSNQYSIEVLVGGRPVREFSKNMDGEYRTFIEGREGSEYQIRIRNNSHKKLLAIAAVDSINVVTGDVSDGYKGRGYIIQPYDSVTIKGYRESDNTVGAFKFTNKHSSYASEKGFEKNSGIIAVNLIEEKEQPVKIIEQPYVTVTTNPWPWRPTIWGTTTAGSTGLAGEAGCSGYSGFSGVGDSDSPIGFACSNQGNLDGGADLFTNSMSSNFSAVNNAGPTRKAAFDLGSTWGERVEDKIIRKHFDKGNVVCSFKLYYASRNALGSMGIELHPKKEINEWPNGFEGYCKPPKSWC